MNFINGTLNGFYFVKIKNTYTLKVQYSFLYVLHTSTSERKKK